MVISQGERQRRPSTPRGRPHSSAWALAPERRVQRGGAASEARGTDRAPGWWLSRPTEETKDDGSPAPGWLGTGCRRARRRRARPVRHRRLSERSPGPGWREHLVQGFSTHRPILQLFIPSPMAAEDEPGHEQRERNVQSHATRSHQPGQVRATARHTTRGNGGSRGFTARRGREGRRRSGSRYQSPLRRSRTLGTSLDPERGCPWSGHCQPRLWGRSPPSFSAARSWAQHGLPERPSGSTGWGEAGPQRHQDGRRGAPLDRTAWPTQVAHLCPVSLLHPRP